MGIAQKDHIQQSPSLNSGSREALKKIWCHDTSSLIYQASGIKEGTVEERYQCQCVILRA